MHDLLGSRSFVFCSRSDNSQKIRLGHISGYNRFSRIMTRGTFFMRGTLMSCVLRSYLSTRMKKMVSRLRILPQLRHLMVTDGSKRTPSYLSYAPFATGSKQHSTKGQRNQQQCAKQSSRGGGWGGDGDGRHRFPVKLMDFPERTMPDIVKSFRNRFFAFLIKAYYDGSFSMDGFLEGATQVIISACVH